MPEYRWVVFKYPDGHTVRTIAEEGDFNAELIRLQLLYGIRYRLGPRCRGKHLAVLTNLKLQRAILGRKVLTPRPLSPDFGRGSGGPI